MGLSVASTSALRKQIGSSSLEEAQSSVVSKPLPLPPKRETLRFELDAVDSEKHEHFVHISVPPSARILSRSSSFTSTVNGHRKSLKLIHVTPTSSVRSMPLNVEPLYSPNGFFPAKEGANNVQAVERAPVPSVPTLGRLRAWEVESLRSRPMSVNTDNGIASTHSSPTSSGLPIQIPSDAPQLDLPVKDFRSSFKSLFLGTDLYPQSSLKNGIIPRKPVPSLSRRQSRKALASTPREEVDVPIQPRVHRGERPFFGGMIHERSSSRSTVGSTSIMNRARGDSVITLPNHPRVPVVNDWNATTFNEVEKILEIPQSFTSWPVHEHFGLRRSSTSSSMYGMGNSLENDSHRRMGSVASHKTYLSSTHLLRAETQTLHEDHEPQEELHSSKSLPNLTILPSTVYSPLSELERSNTQPRSFRHDELIRDAPLSAKTLPDLPLLPASVYAPIFRPKTAKSQSIARREDQRQGEAPLSSKTLPDLPLLPATVYSPEPSPQPESQPRMAASSLKATTVHKAANPRPMSDVLSDVYDSYWEEGDFDRSKKREPLPSRSKSERWTPAVPLTARHPALPIASLVPMRSLQQRSRTRFPVLP
ncbi:hypothetical protein MMC13_002605 [Lambiella insularis]|nr:hypothetical protein [Lambiella insularis]